MSVVPAGVIAEIAVAMTEGMNKYGRHNYREVGVRASVYYDGTMRHLMDWWEGTDIDPDSMMNHVTKAITSLTVLRDCMMNDNWVDDRPPKSKPFLHELNVKTAEIRIKYAHLSPKHYTEINKVA